MISFPAHLYRPPESIFASTPLVRRARRSSAQAFVSLPWLMIASTAEKTTAPLRSPVSRGPSSVLHKSGSQTANTPKRTQQASGSPSSASNWTQAALTATTVDQHDRLEQVLRDNDECVAAGTRASPKLRVWDAPNATSERYTMRRKKPAQYMCVPRSQKRGSRVGRNHRAAGVVELLSRHAIKMSTAIASGERHET
jgi:hypothetical protein